MVFVIGPLLQSIQIEGQIFLPLQHSLLCFASLWEEKFLLRIQTNMLKTIEAVGKCPSAVRHAHGPERSRRAALPSSLVTAAYFYVRLIPRDFGGFASRHFPSASKKLVFRQIH